MSADEQKLQRSLEDLAARLERLEERLRAAEATPAVPDDSCGHTLFVETATGYAVIERDGPPPRPGEELSVDSTLYRAERYRHSPFPDDPRPCVIIQTPVSKP